MALDGAASGWLGAMAQLREARGGADAAAGARGEGERQGSADSRPGRARPAGPLCVLPARPSKGGGRAARRRAGAIGKVHAADAGSDFSSTTSNLVVATQNSAFAESVSVDLVPATFAVDREWLHARVEYARASLRPDDSWAPQFPKLSFSERDSASAAQFYRRQGFSSIAIMNFANGSHAGGGYLWGAPAQEEALCRQWPLYHPSLSQSDQYPFGAHRPEVVADALGGPRPSAASDAYNRVLVTPDVWLMRAGPKDTFRALELGERFPVTMVAAAAPRACWYEDKKLPEGLQDTVIHTVLSPLVAWKQRPRGAPETDGEAPGDGRPRRVLILGAWGCGAFGNKPAQMARVFVDALHCVYLSDQYRELLAWLACRESEGGTVYYDEVHFAVPAFRRADQPNVSEFRNCLHSFAASNELDELDVHGQSEACQATA